jgi:eukaryotic-like serine/threonine-protein kinase
MDARRLELQSSHSGEPGSKSDAATVAGTKGNPAVPSKPPPDPLVGQVVGQRYRIEKLLGTGGMGAVYRAVHVHMRKPVALKVLHRQMTYLPEAVARFEREAVAAGRIAHPNVAAATDFGRLDDDSFYLALEFIEGRSLRNMLHEAGPLPAKRAVNIARQIAEALAAAHAHDIVHRDLKPENVMLQAQGPHEDFVKVLDFGLAKLSVDDALDADGTQLTKLGSIFGTPTYMSPEQASAGAVDYRTDLYALGVVLYEMLVGHPPFEAEAIVLVLSKHINEAPAPLPGHVDPRLAGLVMRLLAKSPSERPESARAVVTELVAMRLSIVPPSMNFRAGALLDRLPPRVRRAFDVGVLWLERGFDDVLRRVGPPSRHLWRKVCARLPVLERRIAVGNRRPTVGTLLGAGLGFTLLTFVVVSTLLGSGESAKVASGSSTTTAQHAEPDEDETASPEPMPKADPLNEDERHRLADIEALPVYKRKVKDWLELGSLLAKRSDYEASTNAYRNAVQLDKDQAKNPVLLGHMRRAAEDRRSYEAAITVTATLLGEHGLDLLYDLWMSTKDNRAKRTVHELAYKKLEVLHLRGSSEALRVRLELEFRKPGECDPLKKTVERATRHADARSLDALRALKKTDGCGASKKVDCYTCLRETDDLDLAIETAREHEAPRFEDGKYVAAQ